MDVLIFNIVENKFDIFIDIYYICT